MDKYTVHQPMIFPPIYLISRFASTQTIIWLGEDWCKEGRDGWHTKFKLQTPQQSLVIPIPLQDRKGKRIDEVLLDKPELWWAKLEKTLVQNFKKTPYFRSAMDIVFAGQDHKEFGPLCTGFVEQVFRYLGLAREFVRSTDLGIARDPDASTWLAKMGVAIDCQNYVCAADATEKYLDSRPFALRGISLVPQVYQMPVYSRVTTASTSVLDLLFKCSPEECKAVLGAS